MKSIKITGTVVLSLILISFATGCGTISRHHSSSVVQYLYPDDKPVLTESIPALSLPLKVGCAFVPETSGKYHNLTEYNRIELMNDVSAEFLKYDFIKSITPIPSAYLLKNGSFSNLDQINRMFDVDVIVLLSYDQTQFTDETILSLMYWTLIGAYIIPGDKNDTHTMMDAAVFDIKSRKMLFRAPGISHIKSHTTPINLPEQLRKDGLSGFKEASFELVQNLDEQLSLFKERVKNSPQDYQIIHKQGYTGGGSLDVIFLIIIAVSGGFKLWTLRTRQNRNS